MDAIVTAGGIPLPGEPLYPYSQGQPKALLDIAGKPMIQWVLEALEEACLVERVILVGLDDTQQLSSSKLTAVVPGTGSLLTNIYAGVQKTLEINPGAEYVLAVSSDIPAITGEMVDWVIGATKNRDADAYYNLIRREVMEARFPGSRRSFTRLRDMEVCGGDMNVIRTITVSAQDAAWQKIIDARKNVLKQAALIGYDTLFLLFTRLLTLERGVQMVTKRLQLKGQAVLCPYAEIGMDVDKPHQLEMMRSFMEQRQA